MEHAQVSGKNSLARSTAQAEAPADVATPASDTGDKRAALPAPPEAPVMDPPPPDEESPSRYDLLKSVWRARGFFGGILAIQIAYYGQRALMDRDDYPFSTFCYGLAILVLILSLLHPNLPRRRAATPTAQAAVVDPPKAAAAVDLAASNGHTPGAASPAAPPEAPAGNATPTALPMRKASSVSASLAATQDSSVEAPGSGTALATDRLETAVPGASPASTEARKAQPNNGSSPQTATLVTAESTVARTAWQRIPKAVARLGAWRAREGWRVTVPALLVAVGLLVWSFFALRANIVEPVGGWLWAGGLVALWVALLGVPGWPRGKSLLPGPREDFFGRGVPSLDARGSVLLVGLVLLAALALRLYNLEYHPGIFGDEGERGSDARDILQGNHILIFGVGWWGVPNLYFYLTSFFLGLLGDHNMVAARMLSVVSGVVAVWYVYRTGRLLWGPRVGLIAAALLAVSPLALQFSRLAGESTPTGTLWAVGFYYMVLALRDRKWTDWLLSGLAWGFSLYFYAAGKMVVPLAAALGLYCLVRWRLDFFRRYALGFALLGATIVVTAMPYVIYSLETNFIYTMSRAEETSIFTPSNQAVTFLRFNLPYDPALAEGSTLQSLVQHPVEWGRLLYEQARETLDVLYRRADQVFFYLITDHGGSMFPAFWATIVMLGIAYATWKLWDSRYALVLMWFWFGLLGSILTVDTPNLQRVTGAWPALMLLPAALLDRIFAAGWPLSLSVARRWATIPLAAAVLFFGYTSVQEYFGHYAATCPYCDSTAQARYATALGQDYKAYQLGLGGYPYYFGHGSTRYLAKDVEGVDLMAAADGLPVVDSNGKGLAFIVYYNNIEYLPLLKLYYPGGTEESISSADGVERFRSYKVTREQLATFQVATATYRPSTGAPVTRDEPGLGTQRAQFIARQVEGEKLVRPQPMEPWTPPAGATYPLQATWEGGLVAPNYGRYLFATNGTATGVRLFVDGMEVIGEGAEPGAPVELVLA
ncbi:MAG TPA: glycosyltransferase family 39 protein, partial [Chloroflexia bacterium]|nr:glycosyltransferase family 39 protein [Chloroflexia bacterium]